MISRLSAYMTDNKKSSNVLPAFIEREGLMPFEISWRCFCWILFFLAVGVFIIAETLAGHVVVRFAVIAPSMILLMLFILMTFVWNRARQMMMLVPGVALGGWAVAQDETLTEQINNILGIVLGVLVAVMCYASYGIANDRCKCCGNQRDRLDTIKYLVSGGLYFGCILVSVVLSKSMFWRAMFTMLLFTPAASWSRWCCPSPCSGAPCSRCCSSPRLHLGLGGAVQVHVLARHVHDAALHPGCILVS